MSRTGVLAEPTLVGREKELEELNSLLDSAIEGKGKTVFVSGEAGSGKTRLVNEFLKTTKAEAIALLSGWCLSDAAIPYFPFIEAFKTYIRSIDERQNERLGSGESEGERDLDESEEAELRDWLTGSIQIKNKQDLTPEAWKDRIFAAISDALRSISARKPTVLFLEDIHWADSASLKLLHYVSHAIVSEKVLVIGTFRNDELVPDAEGRGHPLLDILRLMKRDNLCLEIELSVLSTDSVGRIAEKILGGKLNIELVSNLSEKSRGNPLFVVESLRMWSERKSLVPDEAGLRLASNELGVPSKFKDIIVRRLERLKSSQRRVLDVASILGEKFDPELLSQILEQECLEVLETLNEVARFTSLVCLKGNSFEFDHARSREILYDEIPMPLKKGYHAKIARRLEDMSLSGKHPQLGTIAYHYAQAGNIEKAIRYSLKAGEEALAMFSNTEATKHFSYLLNTAGDSSKYSSERAKALFGLGDALARSGFHRESMRTFERLFEVADSGAMKLSALRRAIYIAIWWGGGRKQALELASKAEEYALFDSLEFSRVRMMRARATGQEGRAEEALRETGEILKIFEEKGNLSDVAAALSQMANYYARTEKNQWEDAFSSILRSVSLYREFGDLHLLSESLLPLSNMFLYCGLFEQALESYAELTRLQEKIGEHNHALPYFYIGTIFETEAMLNSLLDRTDECVQALKAAVEQSLRGVHISEKAEAYYGRLLVFGNLVRLYLKLGDMPNAEKSYERFQELYQKATNIADRWLLAQCFRSKAVYLAAKGQLKESDEYFERSLAAFEKMRGLAYPIFHAGARVDFAASLAKQHRTIESNAQFEKANRTIDEFQKIKARFDCANIMANLFSKREVGVEEEFELRLDVDNVAKRPAALNRIENLIPKGFKVTRFPACALLENGSVEMNSKELIPFHSQPFKIRMKALSVGRYVLEPQLIYTNHFGELKTCRTSPVIITVRPTLDTLVGKESVSVPILPGRLTTGFKDLDVLLYGGIPENYAMVLTSAPDEERELLVKSFLMAGIGAREPTFYLTGEIGKAKVLAEKREPYLYLFVLNPISDSAVQDFPNAVWLSGLENLTNVDIALVKAFRKLDSAYSGPKRACIEILSDVLLQHHTINTRKWLSGLMADFKSKGFTVLAVLNPAMHSSQDVQAILSLFEGEIRMFERKKAEATEKFMRVQKLINQKYLEIDLPLKKERIEQ